MSQLHTECSVEGGVSVRFNQPLSGFSTSSGSLADEGTILHFDVRAFREFFIEDDRVCGCIIVPTSDPLLTVNCYHNAPHIRNTRKSILVETLEGERGEVVGVVRPIRVADVEDETAGREGDVVIATGTAAVAAGLVDVDDRRDLQQRGIRDIAEVPVQPGVPVGAALLRLVRDEDDVKHRPGAEEARVAAAAVRLQCIVDHLEQLLGEEVVRQPVRAEGHRVFEDLLVVRGGRLDEPAVEAAAVLGRHADPPPGGHGVDLRDEGVEGRRELGGVAVHRAGLVDGEQQIDRRVDRLVEDVQISGSILSLTALICSLDSTWIVRGHSEEGSGCRKAGWFKGYCDPSRQSGVDRQRQHIGVGQRHRAVARAEVDPVDHEGLEADVDEVDIRAGLARHGRRAEVEGVRVDDQHGRRGRAEEIDRRFGGAGVVGQHERLAHILALEQRREGHIDVDGALGVEEDGRDIRQDGVGRGRVQGDVIDRQRGAADILHREGPNDLGAVFDHAIVEEVGGDLDLWRDTLASIANVREVNL